MTRRSRAPPPRDLNHVVLVHCTCGAGWRQQSDPRQSPAGSPPPSHAAVRRTARRRAQRAEAGASWQQRARRGDGGGWRRRCQAADSRKAGGQAGVGLSRERRRSRSPRRGRRRLRAAGCHGGKNAGERKPDKSREHERSRLQICRECQERWEREGTFGTRRQGDVRPAAVVIVLSVISALLRSPRMRPSSPGGSVAVVARHAC